MTFYFNLEKLWQLMWRLLWSPGKLMKRVHRLEGIKRRFWSKHCFEQICVRFWWSSFILPQKYHLIFRRMIFWVDKLSQKSIFRCKDPKLTKLKKTELASCNLLIHNEFFKPCHCLIRSFMRKCKKAVCDCQKPENNTYPCHCDVVNKYVRKCAQRTMIWRIIPMPSISISIDEKCPSVIIHSNFSLNES